MQSSSSAIPTTSIDKNVPQKLNRNATDNKHLILAKDIGPKLVQDWDAYIGQSTVDTVPALDENKNIGYCDGMAMITGWKIIDETIGETSIPSGGARVYIAIRCKALSDLRPPLVGFQLVDRRGQIIFDDNTYDDIEGELGTILVNADFYAAFSIIWSFLAPGEYTINLAVSTGTFAVHINHYWINEAIIITAIESTRKVNGLFAPLIENKQLRELN